MQFEFQKRLFSCAVIFAVGTLAHGQSVWDVEGDGNWNTASNWAPSGVPNSNSTDVFIDNNPLFDVTVFLNTNALVRDLTIDAGDQLWINNSQRLSIFGELFNDGIVRINSGLSGTYFQTVGDITFSGSGAVELANSNAWLFDFTNSNNATDHLTNAAGHTLRGVGNIGFANNLQITNQGLIHANVDGFTLNVTPNDNGMVNTGTMRASGGGNLTLNGGSLGSAFIDNTGGIIDAQANSTVTYTNRAHIVGGQLIGEGTHVIGVGNPKRFEDLTVAAGVNINNASRLDLVGTIVNNDVIRIDAGLSSTYLQPVGTVTLTGLGAVELANSNAWLYDATNSNAASDHLINAAGHTIRGAGNIGFSNNLQITNQGLIHANVDGGTLIIAPNSNGMVNTGTMRASGGGTLRVNTASGAFTNLAGGVLTGGTYEVMANSTMRLDGAVNTNAANILLDGVSSNIYSASTGTPDALAGFNNNQGDFTITNGRNFNTAGGFDNSGMLHVGMGSTFTVATGQTLNSTGTLAGNGTIVGDVITSGLLSPGNSIGTLTVDGDLTINAGTSYNWYVDGTGSDLVQIVNGDLIFTGGTLTLNVLLGDDGLPTDGADHLLMEVSGGGLINFAGIPDVVINLPTGWTSNGVDITSTQVLLTNVVIPEPGSIALLGLGGVLLIRRRR